jgi:hypothetical protein
MGNIVGDAEVAELLESLGAPNDAAAIVREMSAARKIDPRAVAVRQQALSRLGFQPAGMTPTTFTAITAAQDINLTVSRPVRPSSLVFPPTLAPFFVVTAFQVNGRNQLASSGALPLELFAPNGIMSRIRFETINPSSAAILSIQMIDLTATRTLRGAVFGAALMR